MDLYDQFSLKLHDPQLIIKEFLIEIWNYNEMEKSFGNTQLLNSINTTLKKNFAKLIYIENQTNQYKCRFKLP